MLNACNLFCLLQHGRNSKSEIDEKTREEILSLIAHHVTAVNYIYRNTKFDGRYEHRNIRFEVCKFRAVWILIELNQFQQHLTGFGFYRAGAKNQD